MTKPTMHVERSRKAGRREQEAQQRLNRLLQRFTAAATGNGVAKLAPDALMQLHGELTEEWAKYARQAADQRPPLVLDPELFGKATRQWELRQEAERLSETPLAKVDPARFGFYLVDGAESWKLWLCTTCALRIHTNGPTELYLAPPPPYLNTWANGLAWRIRKGALVPQAASKELTMGAVSAIAQLLGHGTPAMVAQYTADLATARPGYLNRLWAAILNR